MNQDFKLSSQKRRAVDRLVAAVRDSQTAAGMLFEAFAALLGVNHTDGRCLDIVQRLGQITAGDLARASGLTTGAVTVVIDRLEKAGYVRRVRDPGDRRKVLLELTEQARSLMGLIYSEIGRVHDESMMGRMTVAEMELISRYLRTSARADAVLAELLGQHADGKARDPDGQKRRAHDFSAHISRERDALVADIRSIWDAPDPGTPSGKPADPQRGQRP